MMHTTATADRKDCRQRKRYAEAGWKGGTTTTVRGLSSSYGRQLCCDEPRWAPGDQYARARALRTR